MNRSGSGALVVVAAADQADTVSSLAAHQPLAGVVWRGRVPSIPTAAAPFDTVAQALSCCRPAALVVLIPYRDMAGDVAATLEAGVSCLCAGPPDASPARLQALVRRAGDSAALLQWGGLLTASPSFGRLQGVRQRVSFGQAVYLRWIAGGGRGPVRTWWSLRDMIAGATQLLGSPPCTLWITATGSSRASQATATLSTPGGAAAQLAVCPQFLPGVGQAMLLGTGGLLELEGESGSRLVGSGPGSEIQLAEPETEARWLAQLEADSPPPGAGHLAAAWADLPLLHALRRALASGQPQAVPV